METYKPKLFLEKVKPKERVKTKLESRAVLRPIFMKTGAVSQAVGSAYIEINNTKVIAAIYGPRQSKKAEFTEQGKLWCDFKFAPFAQLQRRKRGQDPDERANALQLSEALSVSIQLNKFPKAVLEAYVLVLEEDGGMSYFEIVKMFFRSQ